LTRAKNNNKYWRIKSINLIQFKYKIPAKKLNLTKKKAKAILVIFETTKKLHRK